MVENHEVVTHDEWIKARQQFLAREKEFTRLRDQLSQQRRDLPWERIDFWDAEMPGASVFYKDPSGKIFHTYSTYGRGLDMLMLNYHFLDLVPKGRDEAGQKPHPQAWVRRHDEYGRTS